MERWRAAERQGTYLRYVVCAMMLMLTKEVPLPHSPRVVTFLDPDTACFAYSATEHAIFQLSTMTVTEITFPQPTVTASSSARGALTGLSGYMSLGFGAKAKACVVAVDEQEALVVRDSKLPCLITDKDENVVPQRSGYLHSKRWKTI